MSVAEFTVGKSGAGGANANYITRLSAAESIEFVKLDQLEAGSLREKKANAVAYAKATEAVELANNAKARTHYRLILTFTGKVENEKAVELSKQMLTEAFPKARAVVAVHQDTDDTHAHIWIEARQEDYKKINLKNKDYEKIDETWTRIYDREFGTNHAAEYAAKKQETRQWKRDYAVAKQNGTVLPKKPIRAADKMTSDKWREKALRDQGAIVNVSNETEFNRDERLFETKTQRVRETDRIVGTTQPVAGRTKSVVAGREAAQSEFDTRIAETEFAASNDQSDFGSGERQTFGADSNIAANRAGTEDAERFARRSERIEARRAARSEFADFQTIRTDSSSGNAESEVGRAALEGVELESNAGVQLQPTGNGVGFAQGGIGLHSLAAFGDGAVVAENRDDAQRSPRGNSEFNENGNERISEPSLYNLPSGIAGFTATTFNQQEDFEEQIYGYEHRGGSFDKESSWEGLSSELRKAEEFRATTVELFTLPEITRYQPQLAPNNEAFIRDILQMIKTNSEEQGKELSLRATKIYESELKNHATQLPTPAQIQYVNKFNENQSETDKISVEDKSRLEVAHEALTAMSDGERTKTFGAKAQILEKQVQKEKTEFLREMDFDRGMSM